jgi:hypothetical protein
MSRRLRKLNKREKRIVKKLKRGKKPPAELMAELTDVQEQKVATLARKYIVDTPSPE